MRILIHAIAVLLLLSICSQRMAATNIASTNAPPWQTADPNFNPSVVRPAYVSRHPRVLFDEAHNSPDTSSGRYKPFVDLIKSDGYRLFSGKSSFTRNGLAGFDVLVIVNAAGAGSKRDSSPFTERECDVVRDWVMEGGALLLVSDHLPYSAAMSELCKRFGVELTKGFTIETLHYNKDSNDQTELVFTREEKLVQDHAITRGRNATEQINKIITFSGTSLKGPREGVAFLKLADTAKDVIPPPPDPKPRLPEEALPEHTQVSAAGRAQALALPVGKGRVVVLADAAMLTAQVAPGGLRFGINVTGFDNRQLALNIMHWLSGLLK